MHDKKWISTAAEIEHVMIRNAIYPPVDPDYLTLIKRVEMAMIVAASTASLGRMRLPPMAL